MLKNRTIGFRRAVAGFACAVAVTACEAQGSPGALERSSSGTAVAEEDIPQAKWKIRTHPSGNLAKIGKRRAKQVRRQRSPLRRLVARVYEGLFLDPARREAILKNDFHPRAATAFTGKIGVPHETTGVKTTLRKADVGIDANGARRAAAAVSVRAKGRIGSRGFAVIHRATLWLERRNGSWRVIAFDIRQRPLK